MSENEKSVLETIGGKIKKATTRRETLSGEIDKLTTTVETLTQKNNRLAAAGKAVDNTDLIAARVELEQKQAAVDLLSREIADLQEEQHKAAIDQHVQDAVRQVKEDFLPRLQRLYKAAQEFRAAREGVTSYRLQGLSVDGKTYHCNATLAETKKLFGLAQAHDFNNLNAMSQYVELLSTAEDFALRRFMEDIEAWADRHKNPVEVKDGLPSQDDLFQRIIENPRDYLCYNRSRRVWQTFGAHKVGLNMLTLRRAVKELEKRFPNFYSKKVLGLDNPRDGRVIGKAGKSVSVADLQQGAA